MLEDEPGSQQQTGDVARGWEENLSGPPQRVFIDTNQKVELAEEDDEAQEIESRRRKRHQQMQVDQELANEPPVQVSSHFGRTPNILLTKFE